MIGVVLWSDVTDGKAVFWCEDQGDLAYFEGNCATNGAHASFDAGDMVQFDVSCDARVRKAHNARLVQGQACVGLPETLRSTGAAIPVPAEPAGGRSAQIIPFARQSNNDSIAARSVRKA